CAAGEACVGMQSGWMGDTAACYQNCNVFRPPSCAPGMGCIMFNVETGEGYCVKSRMAALGQPRGSTGSYWLCTLCGGPAAFCPWAHASSAALCSQPCQEFDADPGCPAGLVCQPNGACDEPQDPPPPTIGEACPSPFPGQFCALDTVG